MVSASEVAPLISIAVTTFNGDQYLRRQLDSLLGQDYPNIEIVVADDCSSDNTIAILAEYDTNDNFRWYQNETNLGYIKNFENVIRRCRGEYIALCDQDDVWYSNKVSKTYTSLIQDDALLAYCDADLIASDDEHIGMNLLSHSSIGPIKGGDYEKFYFLNTVNGCTSLISKELYEMAVPFPSDVPHDWWLAYCAAFEGRLSYLPCRLMGYRMHDNNTVGISYRIKKKYFLKYIQRKFSVYNRRFIINKLTRPTRWTNECLQHFYRFREFELSRNKNVDILNMLIEWGTAKVESRPGLAQYRTFFEHNGGRLGVRVRSVLFASLRYELFRAKLKLAYQLLIPIVIPIFLCLFLYYIFW